MTVKKLCIYVPWPFGSWRQERHQWSGWPLCSQRARRATVFYNEPHKGWHCTQLLCPLPASIHNIMKISLKPMIKAIPLSLYKPLASKFTPLTFVVLPNSLSGTISGCSLVAESDVATIRIKTSTVTNMVTTRNKCQSLMACTQVGKIMYVFVIYLQEKPTHVLIDKLFLQNSDKIVL